MPGTARAKKPSIGKPRLEERIRRRAYELYVQRGNESGLELDDWLQAEEEIRRAQEEAIQEEAINEASEESFPASDSPAYQAIKSIRQSAAKSRIYIVEGLPTP